MQTKTGLFVLLLLLTPLVWAQNWQARSGETQKAVLELFSAEGCGLCPAAYRWVDNLPKEGYGPDKVIVLSFHVDYLNHQKRWVDKFASPVFSDRQRQLARLNLYKTIYTPEFVISGEVVHSWRQHAKAIIDAVNGFKPEAQIMMSAKQTGQTVAVTHHVTVTGTENRQYSQLYLAVVENNVTSRVRGGDNAGAIFHHQHLVRQWLGPFSLDPSGHSTVTEKIGLDKTWNRAQLSLVAIVQNLNDGFVLQGLELPLH